MQEQEVIQVLKEWIPELELMARYNDDSLSYRRYSAIDEVIKKFKEQRPRAKCILAGHNPNFSPFDNSNKYILKCSNCLSEVLDNFMYCPMCGADMRGEEE